MPFSGCLMAGSAGARRLDCCAGLAMVTAIFLRLLVLLTFSATGSAMMFSTSANTRGCNLVSAMISGCIKRSFGRNTARKKRSSCTPSFSIKSSHEICMINDSDSNTSTINTNVPPTRPSIWFMPAAVSEPTKPPAPKGSDLSKCALKANASSTGLAIIISPKPMPALIFLYGGIPASTSGRNVRYNATPAAMMPHHAEKPNK